MQKNNEIVYSSDIGTKDGNWLGATYSKLKKKFEKIE